MRIGVFDSGMGGINVLAKLQEKYPYNEYIFFGDTKNLPYGDKTKEELLFLATDAIDFLLTKNVDIIIIACGTISSTCLNNLKEKYSIPLYDIISPTIRFLLNSNFNKIGVIGTKRTIESNIFNLKNKNVLQRSTPSFVPIIENNQIREKSSEIIEELKCFQGYDILVLGCTHYPLLKDLIKENLKIQIIDMGECLTNELDIQNNSNYLCELYFSSVSVNLVLNIENVLHTNYQIYVK